MYVRNDRTYAVVLKGDIARDSIASQKSGFNVRRGTREDHLQSQSIKKYIYICVCVCMYRYRTIWFVFLIMIISGESRFGFNRIYIYIYIYMQGPVSADIVIHSNPRTLQKFSFGFCKPSSELCLLEIFLDCYCIARCIGCMPQQPETEGLNNLNRTTFH
jgi:hypothetical protein